jgi:periplasmic mercuric ion binding protein
VCGAKDSPHLQNRIWNCFSTRSRRDRISVRGQALLLNLDQGGVVMKSMRTLLVAVIATLALVASAWASPQTVTLNVSGMTCPACPITVKKALEKVPGVSKVDVRFEKKQVLVTFDDAKTNTDALVKATTNAGYPSQPGKAGK